MRLALIVIILMALSFGGGFLWEYERTAGVREQLNLATAQLATAENTAKLCRLQQQLLSLVDDTANKNYGEAAALSTKFFNDLNSESSSATQPQVRSTIQSILSQRDEVTADLAKADPASHDLFVQMSENFHQALSGIAFQPAMSAP
ncbi:MAG: hypothetical protein ACRD4R_02390 [Candidatus Acidiferrales bacterium]